MFENMGQAWTITVTDRLDAMSQSKKVLRDEDRPVSLWGGRPVSGWGKQRGDGLGFVFTQFIFGPHHGFEKSKALKMLTISCWEGEERLLKKKKKKTLQVSWTCQKHAENMR